MLPLTFPPFSCFVVKSSSYIRLFVEHIDIFLVEMRRGHASKYTAETRSLGFNKASHASHESHL
jgi:hypothetical protein